MMLSIQPRLNSPIARKLDRIAKDLAAKRQREADEQARQAEERRRREEAAYREASRRVIARAVDNYGPGCITVPKRPEPTVVKTMRQIMAEVSAKHSIGVRDIKGRSRNVPIVHARQEYMYRAAVETDASYPRIAKLIDRDHTTVIAGVRAHADRNGLPRPQRKGL